MLIRDRLEQIAGRRIWAAADIQELVGLVQVAIDAALIVERDVEQMRRILPLANKLELARLEANLVVTRVGLNNVEDGLGQLAEALAAMAGYMDLTPIEEVLRAANRGRVT